MILHFFENSWTLIWPAIISLALMIVGGLGHLGTKFMKEKYEAYECGFDPFLKKKTSFCIRFFNIAILYLLIDLEIAILLPFFLKNFLLTSQLTATLNLSLFLILFLLLLLLIEWIFGGISWSEDM
uniref:NADH-ubiquinone oxidoreductase chain 3 n=1 Tax=Isodiametra pulchra TaxID=504439 RepID=A0A1X9WDA5_ISOPU|nr:NADH dehydrogenase subunit 3 [Isodiametra pulchra]ARS00908.1 NADH dehydrogenase subunit 3 [Isodiametra pulchra]